jgi:hypothetical protein
MATETFTGDGTTTTYTINPNCTINTIFVIVNGVVLTPTTDYTVSGSTLTLTTVPTSGHEIVIRELLGDVVSAGAQNAQQVAQTAADVSTVFSIALG